MANTERQLYWEHIYQTRALSEVGWYQQIPVTSLQLVSQFHMPAYVIQHYIFCSFRKSPG